MPNGEVIPKDWIPVRGRPGWFAPPEVEPEFRPQPEEEPERPRWPEPFMHLPPTAQVAGWDIIPPGWGFEAEPVPSLGPGLWGVRGTEREAVLGEYPYPVEREARREIVIAQLARTLTGDMAAIDRPAGFETWSADEQIAWAQTNALSSRFVDESGAVISFEEAERLMREEPERMITEVWFLGGGATIDYSFPAGNLYWEGFGAYGELGKPETYRRQRYDPPELLAMKRGILTSKMTYEEKLRAMLELVPEAGTTQGYRRIKEEVLASLTPEELEKRIAGLEARRKKPAPRKPTPEAPAPVDVEELTASIAPYGISVIGNYPYLSPITEAHLRRIPSDVLEVMARYLSEKGLSWSDYIEASRGLYWGGAPPARAGWAVPYQWG